MSAKRPARPAATPAKKAKQAKPPRQARAAAPPPAIRRLVKESTAPVRGETKSLEADGALAFVAATVVMQGAATGTSQLGLEIDGELVHLVRADHLVAQSLSTPNPAGVFATHASYGNHWTVVFGWSAPVRCERGVRLLATIAEDVQAIELALIVGR